MSRKFNVNGVCYPDEHYMVNIDSKLAEIKELVDEKQYFVINRARQYGKTTTLNLLVKYLADQYTVFFISFEGLGGTAFETEVEFCKTICELLYDAIRYDEVPQIDEAVKAIIKENIEQNKIEDMMSLSATLSEICKNSVAPVVLIIDEVDQASNYKVFIDFLGMLRSKFLKRNTRPTFHSVILAGVYDIKNLKHRIREDREHQMNSPWNIAADFPVDMSFTVEEIEGMLNEYNNEHSCVMLVRECAKTIFEYTSGYPYLVSKICKLIDERCGENWTKQGVSDAVKILLREANPLFDDLRKKITDYPELRAMLYAILFRGESYPYNPDNFAIDIGTMFGFIKEKNGQVVIANRIFETRLYNLFLSEELTNSIIYQSGERDKNQFIKNGVLDMELVLEKFMIHFHDIYGDNTNTFVEENGRRLFLLYLKPIINGTGNYYIEAQTRDQTRTDIIVDYLGKQYVIELKIWHGNEYNKRGEEQLAEYLEYYHLDKGYLLSFNFNKNKQTGLKEIQFGDKILVEVVVCANTYKHPLFYLEKDENSGCFYSLIYKNSSFSFRPEQAFFNFWEAAASISGFSLRECVGQTLIQRIQEIHLSLSVCVGLSDGIAPDGHFAAHNPQEPQVCEAPGISGIVPYSR